MLRPLPRPALLLALALTACAGPLAKLERAGDVTTARALLAAQAEQGPVPLVVDNPPPGLTPGEIARWLAEGVPALGVSFRPAAEAPEGEHLRLRFLGREQARGAPCSAGGDMGGPPELLLLAYCEGARSVARVVAEPAQAGAEAWRRTLWAAARALFPDRYPEEYGFDLFGPRVRIGIGVELGL